MSVDRMMMAVVVWAGAACGAVHEVVFSPSVAVAPGRPATVINWSVGGLPRYDVQRKGYLLGGFSGRLEVPDGFDKFFGGSALLEVRGRDAARVVFFDDLVIPDDDGFDEGFVLADFWPYGEGGVAVLGRESGDTRPRLYQVNRGGGLVAVLEGVARLDGVGQRTGRVIFDTTVLGKRGAILAWAPGGGTETETVVGLGDDGGGGSTIAELLDVQVNRQGRAAFFARLEGAGVEFISEIALFRETASGAVERVMRSGVAHPADGRLVDGGRFGRMNWQRPFGLNDAGVVAFMVTVSSDTFPAGSADSIWLAAPGEAPVLVAVTGEVLETFGGGDVVFESFSTEPVVDAVGDVVFFGSTRPPGTNVEPRLGMWGFSADGLELLTLLDDGALPFPPTRVAGSDGAGIELSYSMEIDGFNEVMGFQAGPDGRLAIRAIVTEVETRTETPAGGGVPQVTTSRERMAQGIWAQDEDGLWDLVQVNLLRRRHGNNPAGDGTGELVDGGGTNFGKVGGLFLSETRFTPGSGGEDGLVQPWWTDDGRLMYQAGVVVDGQVANYLVRATVGGEALASGRFVWQGGTGTRLWRTPGNWLDDDGERWGRAPGGQTTDEVVIGGGAEVELHGVAGEVASLQVDGKLVVESGGFLKVRDDVFLRDLTVVEGERFVAKGDVTVSGDLLGAESGLKSEPDEAGKRIGILPGGRVTGTVTGLWSVATDGVEIVNEGSVSGIDGVGMLVESATGDVGIVTAGEVTSSGSKGLVVRTGVGSIRVTTPPGAVGARIGAVDDGILAEAQGEVAVDFSGEVEVQTAGQSANGIGIHAVSSGGEVEVLSRGTLSTAGVAAGLGTGSGIWAKGEWNVAAAHVGTISATGWAIKGESRLGDVELDSSGAMVSSESGGLVGIAEFGGVEIYYGELATSNGHGVWAGGSGPVSVEGFGDITTIGERPDGVVGILAESLSGSVTVLSQGDISTTSTVDSPGIYGAGEGDVLVFSDGDISTFNGSGIEAESLAGRVNVAHGGGAIAATNEGAGIFAFAGGELEVSGEGRHSGIATQGGEDADGIVALAGATLRVDWEGDIDAASDGVVASGGASGVEVVTRGRVEGRSGDGIAVEGASVLTVRVLGGSVKGGGAGGVGVRFTAGTANRLVNAGGLVLAPDGVAVDGGAGAETVKNSGEIEGVVFLRGGSNAVENLAGGVLRMGSRFEVGAGNTVENSGRVELLKGAGNVANVALQGDFVQHAGGTCAVDLVAGGGADWVVVSGRAELGGVLQIAPAGGGVFEVGEEFEVLTAGSVSGRFARLDQAAIGGNVRFEIVYEETRVLVVAVAEVSVEFGGWRRREFSAERASDDAVSGVDVDTDGDGLTNLLEYLFGTDPEVANVLPFGVLEAGMARDGRRYVDVEFRWAVGTMGYTYGFETWSGVPGEGWEAGVFEVAGGETVGGYEIVRARVFFAAEDKVGFVRMVVFSR